MEQTSLKHTTIVIFGASGDLTQRKLGPALYNNFKKGRLTECAHIIGFARRPYSNEDFRDQLLEGVQANSPETYDAATWEAFGQLVSYFKGNFDQSADFKRLAEVLRSIEGGPANRLYYLATAPEYYPLIITSLGEAGLAEQKEGGRNIIIEKPFGQDLASAQALNQTVHQVFEEKQVYRIDHYLGKETAQNILFLRFANTIFEPVWNRRYVDTVQITVAETVDVGQRGEYYNEAGVVRDMFQNHLLQLLALVAMEPPASFNADALRNETAKVFTAIRPIELMDTVRAQYEGYRETEGVAPGSQTATFAAMKLYIDNWRWQGVPFYLRSGKALRKKSSEITIEFMRPPHLMFELPEGSEFNANHISICIQPNEGIHLRFEAKVPDSEQAMRSVNMEFHYRDSFGDLFPDAYERLLLDAMHGDASLFTRSDGIEAAWRLIDPILDGWERQPELSPLATYDRGSMGPMEAEDLVQRDGRHWCTGCDEH